MDEIFSAPKVQISRIVDKFLDNGPSQSPSRMACMREMSEVVAVLTCFGQYLCEDGTCAESACRLIEQAQQDAEERKARRQREIEEARRRRQARKALGANADSDLEDDDVEEEPERDEAHHKLLSCMSLSKVMVDFKEANGSSSKAEAIASLMTNSFNVLEAGDWAMSQVLLHVLDIVSYS
jgi:hypothetical protein